MIEYRWADGDYARLPELAQELVRLKVDLIVAVASPCIRAAQQATTTIPIVMTGTGDPVGSGFAKSLARPGGNITGMSLGNLEISTKLLGLLKEIDPKLSHVALLSNPGSSTQAAFQKSIQSAAQKVGVQVLPVESGTVAQIEHAFPRMTQAGVQALIISGDSFLNTQVRRIAELALSLHLPSITQIDDYAKVGGLISYGVNIAESFRRTATYVDKILKGAKPGDLPIEQPTTYELIVNLKTARALGVKISDTILLQATGVIE